MDGSSRQAVARLVMLPDDAPLPTGMSETDWMTTAAEEGVVSVIHSRLSARADVPKEVRDTLTESTRVQMAYAMAFEAQTRRILKLLADMRTPALLLKGAALAHWAYPKPHMRACGDVDVFLPGRDAADALSGALEADGFECLAPSGALVAYEMMCQKPMAHDWALEVDIHWRLSNSVLHADRFTFEELMEASVPIPTLGPNARGLGRVHAMLHAAMHRASNIEIGIGDRLKWLYDFEVLNQHLTPTDWEHLTALASERGLAGVMLSAMEATTESLGTRFPAEALQALRMAGKDESLDATRLSDWRYMQAQNMRALPGVWPKLRWLWQRLFPSRDYMTYLYGERGSYAALMWQRMLQAARKLGR